MKKCAHYTADFIVIGGGIIGLSVALRLRTLFPEVKIRLIEKEAQCGLHGSGRNSGVLHAGFYYSPDSLKARFTRLGNERLSAYCDSKKIPLNRCGKLVVAKDEHDLPTLDELLKRGQRNGVVLHALDEKEVHHLEPRAHTYERAIFSPSTSSVDPKVVMRTLDEDARQQGILLHYHTQYQGLNGANRLKTSQGNFQAGYIINAAGLYADKVAKDFGFGKKYAILPFKGIYLYSNEPAHSFTKHIYPVPDLKNPFLGVHFTQTVNGATKIGPTAIPAFWREQYQGLAHFNLGEVCSILHQQLRLFTRAQFNFKQLAIEEIKKYYRPHLVRLASQLAPIQKAHYTQFGTPGIRAQLLNVAERKLEMDFILEGDERSLHILNAVSPGFTSAIPFAEHVCDTVGQLLK